MRRVSIFDSTLRDGAQGSGVTFSVEDKLKIVKILDQLGVECIEEMCIRDRFIPNKPSRYDDVLGIELSSDNQFAERIS